MADHIFFYAMLSIEPACQVGSWVLRRLHTGWVRWVLVTDERCTWLCARQRSDDDGCNRPVVSFFLGV